MSCYLERRQKHSGSMYIGTLYKISLLRKSPYRLLHTNIQSTYKVDTAGMYECIYMEEEKSGN
jgi:hypothetical protein